MYAWLRQHKVVLSCGFFLVISTGLAILNVRAPSRPDPAGALLLEAMLPLQLGATVVGRGVEQVWDQYFDLRSVRRENDTLRQQVGELEQRVQQLVEMGLANQRLQRLLDLQAQIEAPTVAARIVGRSPGLWADRLVLDKGTQNGMRKDSAVLMPAGIVGRIVFTTAHTARVMLASDPSSGIDAFVQRTRERGIVVGTGNGRARLKYVPKGADVRVGDVLLASGQEGIFPKGHPLGSVFRIGTMGGEMFEDVEVRLNVEFAKLEEVLVTTGGPQYAQQ